MAPVITIGVERGDDMALPGLVGRVVEDVKDVARAEVGVYKAKVSERLSAYKGAAIFFVLAAILALEAIGALLVGLILTLATLVGPGFATLIVVGIVVAIVAALAFVGKTRLAAKPEASA